MPIPSGVPTEIGGGPTRDEAAHMALHTTEGTLAGPPDGLEDAWRRIRAKALVGAAVSVELACMQALPAFSTAHIPVYEKLLRITPGPTDTEEDRRQRINAVWTAQTEANIPALSFALRTINSRLSAGVVPPQYVSTTRPGQYYRPIGATSFNHPRRQNHSNAYILLVKYVPELGETTIPDEVRIKAVDFLSKALPAHMDWVMYVGEPGFFLDGGLDGTSLLDSKLLGH